MDEAHDDLDNVESADTSTADEEGGGKRKLYLALIVALIAFAAIVSIMISVNTMKPDMISRDLGYIEVDLTQIDVGEAKLFIVPSPHKEGRDLPVFVLHRDKEMIEIARSSAGVRSGQKDEDRTERPEWLIVSAVSTHLGEQVRWSPDGKTSYSESYTAPGVPIFWELEHGAVWDVSGRHIRGPAKGDLEIPDVIWLSDTKVKISVPDEQR